MADRVRGKTREEMLMAIRKLGKAEWQRYFDRISKAVIGKRAEIEIASLALGDQIEAEWLPLLSSSGCAIP
jgi:hypothetical protein